MSNKYLKPAVLVIFLAIFAALFIRNTAQDLPLIYEKDLRAHDESSNSVVTANITRKFFPPMVRVNPLNENQAIWMEGPHWQHIPPMFAYVPFLFYQMDGEITIEVKRLSFAFLILLTGLLFISVVYLFSKDLLAAFAALVAALFWINSPFTHELITGYAFGVSDIVLAFTSVAAFCGLLWYLNQDKPARLGYPWKKLALIGLLVVLPIMAKNLLGAIPLALLAGLLLWDHRKLGRSLFYALGGAAAGLVVYYLPLAIASPVTFKNEILIAFFHVGGSYEGWGRPWHYYFSNYLPQRYLFGATGWFWLGLAFASIVALWYLIKRKVERKNKILIVLPLFWFWFNLLAITVVSAKIPNFIYQSYLFSVFAIVFSLLLWMDRFSIEQFNSRLFRFVLAAGMIVSLGVGVHSFGVLSGHFNALRAQTYIYDTEAEKFYQTGELLRELGLSASDLTVVRVSDNDCWLRYNILFLTGAESKTLLEMYFGDFSGEQLKSKYNRLWFVFNPSEAVPAGLPAYQRIETPSYSVIGFDLGNLTAAQVKNIVNAFVAAHQADIQTDVERIKDDKTSCQWLVPDEILNTP